MSRLQLTPDTVSYSIAISACEKGGKWQLALSLFSSMSSMQLTPCLITCNCIFDAVRHQPLAYPLFLSLLEDRMFPSLLASNRGCLDLHGFSKGTAVQAVKWWMTNDASAQIRESPHACLKVITGWGCSRRPGKAGDIQTAIMHLLEIMGFKCSKHKDPGTLILDAGS